MADEVPISATGTNGNGMRLNLKERTAAFSGPLGIAFLLIVAIIVIGWLRSKELSADLKDIKADMHASLQEVNAHLQRLYQGQTDIRGDMQAQNKLVFEQTGALTKETHEQTTQLTANRRLLEDVIREGFRETAQSFKELWQQLVQLNHQVLPPEQRPSEPPPAGGERR